MPFKNPSNLNFCKIAVLSREHRMHSTQDSRP